MRRSALLCGLVFGLLVTFASIVDAQYPPDIVEMLQERLYQRGYYHGPMDGNWDRRTAKALRRYQQDYDLPVTGDLNPQTARNLGIPIPGEGRRGLEPPSPPDGPPDYPSPPGGSGPYGPSDGPSPPGPPLL